MNAYNEPLEIIVLREQVKALTAVVNETTQALQNSKAIGPISMKRIWDAVETLQYAGMKEQQDYERRQEP